MIQYYRERIFTVKKWLEPKKPINEPTKEQQVTYWLQHRRELDTTQTWQPRSYTILSKSLFDGRENDSPKNPALELEKLGMVTIPQLINHLDDLRPTRCMGYWRFYAREGHYLLRYGDCCQQLFEAITGHTLYERKTTVGYPCKDGVAKNCKAKAQKWWSNYTKSRTNQ